MGGMVLMMVLMFGDGLRAGSGTLQTCATDWFAIRVWVFDS